MVLYLKMIIHVGIGTATLCPKKGSSFKGNQNSIMKPIIKLLFISIINYSTIFQDDILCTHEQACMTLNVENLTLYHTL